MVAQDDPRLAHAAEEFLLDEFRLHALRGVDATRLLSKQPLFCLPYCR